MPDRVKSAAERFSGFADLYDRGRPAPPEALVDLLAGLAGMDRPRCVVDLGCGTGLSTRVWADRAGRVIGIDASADMLRAARARTTAPNILYWRGLAQESGLPPRCADIVTMSAAIHWMPPGPVFAEIGRVLRPGGAFAWYDTDEGPLLIPWQADRALRDFMRKVEELDEKRGVTAPLLGGTRQQYHDALAATFRYTRKITLHHVEQGGVDRVIDHTMSIGAVATMLKMGVSAQEIGLDALRENIRAAAGDAPLTWVWSFEVHAGVL